MSIENEGTVSDSGTSVWHLMQAQALPYRRFRRTQAVMQCMCKIDLKYRAVRQIKFFIFKFWVLEKWLNYLIWILLLIWDLILTVNSNY